MGGASLDAEGRGAGDSR